MNIYRNFMVKGEFVEDAIRTIRDMLDDNTQSSTIDGFYDKYGSKELNVAFDGEYLTFNGITEQAKEFEESYYAEYDRIETIVRDLAEKWEAFANNELWYEIGDDCIAIEVRSWTYGGLHTFRLDWVDDYDAWGIDVSSICASDRNDISGAMDKIGYQFIGNPLDDEGGINEKIELYQ